MSTWLVEFHRVTWGRGTRREADGWWIGFCGGRWLFRYRKGRLYPWT